MHYICKLILELTTSYCFPPKICVPPSAQISFLICQQDYFIAFVFSTFFSKAGSPLLPELSTNLVCPPVPAPPPSLGSGLPTESRTDVTKGFRVGPEGRSWTQVLGGGLAPTTHAHCCSVPRDPKSPSPGFCAATSRLNPAKLLPGGRE